jgi:hypothetical protein
MLQFVEFPTTRWGTGVPIHSGRALLPDWTFVAITGSLASLAFAPHGDPEAPRTVLLDVEAPASYVSDAPEEIVPCT